MNRGQFLWRLKTMDISNGVDEDMRIPLQVF